jgi:hypothetical protein
VGGSRNAPENASHRKVEQLLCYLWGVNSGRVSKTGSGNADLQSGNKIHIVGNVDI